MADFVYNRALGRVAELANRVNADDPANSVFLVLALGSAAADATLKDLDDIAAIEANGSTAEATNSGYSRKSLNQAAGITVTIDDTNDRTDVDIPDQTWTAVATSPGAWTDLVTAYDSDTTGGTDANIIPMTQHDFAVTPDGSDITAQIAAAGFFRAA